VLSIPWVGGGGGGEKGLGLGLGLGSAQTQVFQGRGAMEIDNKLLGK